MRAKAISQNTGEEFLILRDQFYANGTHQVNCNLPFDFYDVEIFGWKPNGDNSAIEQFILEINTINDDLVWSGEMNVFNPITITDGTTLTISPGSIIHFQNGSGLYVEGTLNIDGDRQDRVLLGSDNGWDGITLSSDHNSIVNIAHTDITNSQNGIKIADDYADDTEINVVLSNVLFSNNGSAISHDITQYVNQNNIGELNLEINNSTFINSIVSFPLGFYASQITYFDKNIQLNSSLFLGGELYIPHHPNLQIQGEYNNLFNTLDIVQLGDNNTWENNFNLDPMLDDNYHLTWENFPLDDETKSPCIDAGDPTSFLDFDGTISDIGAFYFHQLMGDVNFNGTTNIENVLFLVNYILGIGNIILSPNQIQIADMNYDGNIDIYDVLNLVDYILEGTMDYVAPEGTIYYTKIVEQREYPPYVLLVDMYCDVPVRGMQMTLDIPPRYRVDEEYIFPGDFAETEEMDLAVNTVRDQRSEQVKYLYYSGQAFDFDPGFGTILEVGMTSQFGAGRAVNSLPNIATIEAMGAGSDGSKLNIVELSPEEFEQLMASKKSNQLPEKFTVYPAYPNPFNPVTTLNFELPEKSTISCQIFDLLGKEIKSFKRKKYQPGTKSLKWNGQNNLNKPVSSGVYLMRFNAESLESKKTFSASQKVILLK